MPSEIFESAQGFTAKLLHEKAHANDGLSGLMFILFCPSRRFLASTGDARVGNLLNLRKIFFQSGEKKKKHCFQFGKDEEIRKIRQIEDRQITGQLYKKEVSH